MSAPSPVTSIDQLAITFSITVNGSAIKDSDAVASINVFHEINRISYAEVVIIGDSVTTNILPITDSDDFLPGNSIEIATGYGNDEKIQIFKGVIVKHSIEINPSSTFNLKVLCKHAAVSMTFNKTEALFSKQTDSGVVQSILGNYSFDSSVESTNTQHESMFQKSATDWDFILSRAEINGFIITMDDDTLKVGKPVLSGSPVLRIAIGDSIIAFNAELNAEKQPGALNVGAWNIQQQALSIKKANEPSVNGQGNVSAQTLSGKLSQTSLNITANVPLDDASLQGWADATLLRMRLSAFKGQVTFIGSASVKTGDIISLEGVGQKFNGNAYVSAVSHSLEKGTWRTTAKFGLENRPISEKANFSYTAAIGQLPAMQGLQVATVKKLSEDPQSQSRILVNIPSEAANTDGIWVRVANPYATSNAGSFFMPEIGDEVIVGFLENDPRFPVMLGSLYSNVKKPAVTVADDKNNTKSFVTRSNMKLEFDEEKKVITITTPGNNSITLSDDEKSINLKDQNGNTITMDSSGITMKSASDINIQAKGSCSIEATGAVNVKSQQDVAVSGLNINNTAQMGFTGKGNASAELSAAGQVKIQGAMVMIN